MTFFRVFLMTIICAFGIAPQTFAGVGSIDNRQYVNWSNYPQIVHLEFSDVWCTGQYVAPNIILTAAHCVADSNGNVKNDRGFAWNYKQQRFPVKLGYHSPQYKQNLSGRQYDYAFLLVQNKEYYAGNNGFYYVKTISPGSIQVYNAGFGWVTVLSNDEIKKLKADYLHYRGNKASEIEKRFTQILGRPLRDNQKDHKLKVDSGCKATKTLGQSRLTSDCDAWPGNSGGAAVDTTDRGLIGIIAMVEEEEYEFSDDRQISWLTSVDVFNNDLQALIQKYSTSSQDATKSNETSVGNVDIEHRVADMVRGAGRVPGADNAISDQRRKDLGAKKQGEQKKLEEAARKPDLTDREILEVVKSVTEINRIEELEKAYEQATEHEKKYALASGASMAAMGLGGMELGKGIAEKQTDKEAEADMRKYISSFRCTVGDKPVAGMSTNNEVPGANQLIELYQKYADLAESIKQRKEALGMKPGIESQVAMSKAGLYDNVGQGIVNGTYPSLYRAAKGNQADIAGLQEKKDATERRLQVGGALTVAGAALGVATNVVAQRDKASAESELESRTSDLQNKGETQTGLKRIFRLFKKK